MSAVSSSDAAENPAIPPPLEHRQGVVERVIQQVNDYQREVFNGDLGTITTIDLEEQEVTVVDSQNKTANFLK